jgi:uncharacterized protein
MSARGEEPEEELFLVACGDHSLLYAPLRRGVASLNAAAIAAVDRYLRGGAQALAPGDEPVIERLKEGGILGGAAPEPPRSPENAEFLPYETTLFLTTRCNLRCVYCYADGGSRAERELPWEAARAAIDLVARNAKTCGRDNFILGFHGGGEPTMAWETMKRCVEYAREEARRLGLKANVHSATNGLLSPAQRDYVIRNFTGLNVSLDGPEDVQDRNRPKADGSGSFGQVMENLKAFEKAGFDFGIRVTVTAQSAARLPEICDYLFGEFKALKRLHAEPVWYCGRCRTSGERPPDPMAFSLAFLDAQTRARRRGRNVEYSGARLDSLSNKFCAAPGDGFSVMPDGHASTCYEVCDGDDPRSRIFHYGSYDGSRGEFIFDQERLRALRALTVDKIPHCGDCFCKWHCAGDCLAKALKTDGPEGHQGSERCEINRAIAAAGLEEMVELAGADAKGKGVEHG